MTVALRKMEEKGYVSRKTDEKDQRITRIQLAPKGEECIDGIRRVLTEMEEIIYQGISREEVLLMKRLLAEMKNNLLEGYRHSQYPRYMSAMTGHNMPARQVYR